MNTQNTKTVTVELYEQKTDKKVREFELIAKVGGMRRINGSELTWDPTAIDHLDLEDQIHAYEKSNGLNPKDYWYFYLGMGD